MTFWNDERTENLKTRWAQGDSASTIAESFGTTRNAVIGKAHRMGLAERATYQRKPVPKRIRTHIERPRIATTKRVSLVPIPAEPLPPPHVTDVARVSFLELDQHHCRWVCATDVPNLETPQFCGCKKLEGLPYCENHARRAYQPLAERPKTIAKANKVRAMAENSLGKLNGDLKRLLALT